MKIIAIGDLHGKDCWKKFVAENMDADKIVFMGDYFDSFDIPYEDQLKNFHELISFKKDNKDKVVLLIGNHDFHYMQQEEKYSGYQYEHCIEIGDHIKEAMQKGLMQVAYVHKNILFTHAGITKTWLESRGLEEFTELERALNASFEDYPEWFKFTPSNPLDNTGDSITQGPLWVRPRALESDCIEGYTQVVGHTHVPAIKITASAMKGSIMYTDALDSSEEFLELQEDDGGTLVAYVRK